MNDENSKVVRIHETVLNGVDKYTEVYVKNTPMRGEKGKYKHENFKKYKWCGACGGTNTKCIHATSGGTADGTVEVQEVECLDCGNFTMY